MRENIEILKDKKEESDKQSKTRQVNFIINKDSNACC